MGVEEMRESCEIWAICDGILSVWIWVLGKGCCGGGMKNEGRCLGMERVIEVNWVCLDEGFGSGFCES